MFSRSSRFFCGADILVARSQMIRCFLFLFVFLPFLSFGQEGNSTIPDYTFILSDIQSTQNSILSDLQLLANEVSTISGSQSDIASQLYSIVNDLSVGVQALNGSYSTLMGLLQESSTANGRLSNIANSADSILQQEQKDNPANGQLALDSTLQGLVNQLGDLASSVGNIKDNGVKSDVDWSEFIDLFSDWWWHGGGPGGAGGGEGGGGGGGDCNYDRSDFDSLFDWLGSNLGLTQDLQDALSASYEYEYKYLYASPDAKSIHEDSVERPYLTFVEYNNKASGQNYFQSSLEQRAAQLDVLIALENSLCQVLALLDKTDDASKDEVKGIVDGLSVDSVRDSFDIDGTLNPLKDKFSSIDNPLPKSFNSSVPSSVKFCRMEFSFGNTHFDLGDLKADSSIYGEFVENARAVSIAMIYFFLSAISLYIFFFLWRLVHKYFAGFASYVGFVP